jgi:hypothetical protein
VPGVTSRSGTSSSEWGAIKRRAAGETLAEIAKSYAVDISMISRLAPGFRAPFEGDDASA